MKKLALAAMVVGFSCDVPPVFATADPTQSATSGRIEGKVVATGQSRGDVVLLLFDAARLPPPYGTGRPLTFSTVKASALFGNATGDGPFTAPFAFSLVPPGNYFVAGLIDTNADFIPFYTVTADVNAGDLIGGTVDPLTFAPRPFQVTNDALDVGVSFGDVGRVPVDRPAFQVMDPAPSITVGAMGAVVTLVPQPIEAGAVHEPHPVFLAQLTPNGTGLLWPKVVVRKLADPRNPVIDDNDADKNGLPDDPGKGIVVLGAGFDPTDIFPQLVDGMGMPKPTPTPVGQLTLKIFPQAFDATDPKAPKALPAAPSGAYSITLIAPTGQTWRVPNELAPPVATVTGLPPFTSQAFIIQVP
jgi:hypothetical protein